jgi:glutaminyl-peptide cyclotransferase
LGIKAIDIIDMDYPYWHTTKDDISKVSAKSLGAVGNVIEKWIEK